MVILSKIMAAPTANIFFLKCIILLGLEPTQGIRYTWNVVILRDKTNSWELLAWFLLTNLPRRCTGACVCWLWPSLLAEEPRACVAMKWGAVLHACIQHPYTYTPLCFCSLAECHSLHISDSTQWPEWITWDGLHGFIFVSILFSCCQQEMWIMSIIQLFYSGAGCSVIFSSESHSHIQVLHSYTMNMCVFTVFNHICQINCHLWVMYHEGFLSRSYPCNQRYSLLVLNGLHFLLYNFVVSDCSSV